MRLRSVMDDESRLFGPTMAGTINMEGEFYSEVLDFKRGVTQPPGSHIGLELSKAKW